MRRAKFLPQVDAVKTLNEALVIIARDNLLPLPTAQNEVGRRELPLLETDGPTPLGKGNIGDHGFGLVLSHGFLRYLMVGISLPSNREDFLYAIILTGGCE